MTAVVILAAALAALASGPATAAPPPEIIGGRPADPGEYPFQVALLQHGVGDRWAAQFCGGTLISPDTVLTAGHCVAGARGVDVDVLAGTNRLLPGGGRRVPARAIHLHPGFWRAVALEHDLAVVQLWEDLPYGTVRPAFGGDEAWYPEGTPATTIGWGDQDPRPNHELYPTHLREVEVPIVGDADCAQAYPDEFVADQMVCAGDLTDGGEDACYGDSGGPLLVPDDEDAWVQIGIVSTGRGCARRAFPGVYTEVAAHEAFVRRYTEPDTVPDQVTRVRRRAVAERSVRLRWRPPAFDGGTRITRYRIDLPSLGRTHLVAGSQHHVRLRDLPPGRLRVDIRAVNPHGAGPVRSVAVRAGTAG